MNTMTDDSFQHMTKAVQLQRIGDHVAWITLNRPEACNAVNGALARELEAAAREVEDDPALRVAVLAGAGTRAFCAGADLKAVAEGRVAELSTPDGGFAGFVGLPRRKAWIAAVHSAVLAGGLEIMLACDFAIAAEDASFGLPEVRRGLVATEGGLYRLPRSLPRGLALRMIATGEPIGAKEALAHGLVSQVVAHAQLRDTALRVASVIAANAPLAVHESLAIARDASDQVAVELARRSREVLARLQYTEDFQEGARAFVERRLPRWTGK